MRRETTTTHDRGTGLARGPAYIIGTILAAFGLIMLISGGDDPINFATAGFPDADVTSDKFIGFEWNGWTAWITITAGVLLLFGAAQHALAKGFSLVVGLALGACALIGWIDGDVLGLAAANWLTELGWGIAAVLLVLNVFAPRVGGDDHDHDRDAWTATATASTTATSTAHRWSTGTATASTTARSGQSPGLEL